MTKNTPGALEVRYIQEDADLKPLWTALDRAEWFGFDTEFIGEKRDVPLLCLLQVVTQDAVWLVDTLRAEGWTRMGMYIEDPGISKFTHAGENDYRLLYQLLGVLPRKAFDLQVAAGFIGLRYPSGLSSILQEVLSLSPPKSFTVADWSVRPLPDKMKQYAVEDVCYLPALFDRIRERLSELGREAWVWEEMQAWEKEETYLTDPLKRLLQQKSIAGFHEKEKLFMLRLARWREGESQARQCKSEEILSNKQLVEMAKVIGSGSEALFRSRILPKSFVRAMKDHLTAWYQEKAKPDELTLLYQYAPREVIDPAIESRTQLVLHLLQTFCQKQAMSIDLVLPASEAKRYRIIPGYRYEGLYEGWRSRFLPVVWRELLENRESLEFELRPEGILLTHKP